MSFFGDMINALFRERHSTTFLVTIPTKEFMALETFVYIKNETSEDGSEIDRDYVMALALAHFLQDHLVDRNKTKIAAITPPPEYYTNGRKQARST